MREREKQSRKHSLAPAGFYGFLRRLTKPVRSKYNHFKRWARIEKLAREIKLVIEKYSETDYTPPPSPSIPKTVWSLWYDDANMPEVVACCLERMRTELPKLGFQVNILDKDTISDYIDMSDIMPFLESKKISLQFFSDILRIRLLWKYGGFWLDSTIALADPAALDHMVSSMSFVSLKLTKPGSFGHITAWASFFWGSAPGNPFFAYIAEALVSYLMKNRKTMCYFQFDYTIYAGYLHIPFIKSLIDNLPDYYQGNIGVHHELFRRRSEPYDKRIYEKIAKDWPIQKLPRREEYPRTVITPEGEFKTFYGYIADNWLPESTRAFAKPTDDYTTMETYI